MTTGRSRRIVFLLGVFIAGCAAGASADDSGARPWVFSGSIMGYLVPHDDDFVLPTLSADRGPLHLEARYNYEAQNTASLWGGLNWGVGDSVRFDFTAMAAGVFGEIDGAAPGYRATLAWKKLELFTEGEYFLDSEGRSGDFFYTWSEISLTTWDWLRVGGVVQKTQAYETQRDLQRGFLIGIPLHPFSFTTYIFNPDEDPLIVLGASAKF